ncbi:hypothetical protein JOF53_000377 [Crossiella equi]|uniref:Uncharacterized protein n=1 Tax=Crossiella equi TaxID=130796 RepID=A0ABS5A730_9PSEU|nr:hypothetical protein [Crossiella equi]MBP2471505.1 hypothetical protein [Crossiella equi]
MDEDTSIWVDPGVGSGLVLIVDQPDLRLTVELDRTTAGELCEVLAAVMDELEGAAGQVGDGE